MNQLINESISMAVKKRKTFAAGVTFDTVREIAQMLPGAEESTSYRTPAFKVKGKLFARQHQDGESLVIPVDFEAREEMIIAAPEKFYITDHYLNYPYLLVRMSKVNADEMRDLLTGAWRKVAPRKLAVGLNRPWLGKPMKSLLMIALFLLPLLGAHAQQPLQLKPTPKTVAWGLLRCLDTAGDADQVGRHG